MRDELGLCPACEQEGAVGLPCTNAVCARRGLHRIPRPQGSAYAAAPRRSQDPMVGQMVDDFLIVDTLGEGGFGRVYRVLQRPLLRLGAALKIMRSAGIDPETLRRMREKFEGEAAALAVLSHPNIVRLLKYGLHEGVPYLVLELVDDAWSLEDEIYDGEGRARRPELGRTRHVLGQLLDALEAAHAAGVVHRDVKPDNVLLQAVPGNPAFVRVLDFGLAKFVEESSQTSVAVGTPFYMAPEQLSRRHIGPWTDLYAVGVLAYQFLTGRLPFPDGSSEEILGAKLLASYDLIGPIADLALPEPVIAFFRRALATDPEARYRTVADLRAGLHLAMAALQALEPPPTIDLALPEPRHPGLQATIDVAHLAPTPAVTAFLPGSPPRPLRRPSEPLAWARAPAWPRWAVGVAVLATAVVVLGVALFVRRGEREAPPPQPAGGMAPLPAGAVVVGSAPPGAEVWAAATGTRLGVTPLQLGDLAALPDRRIRLTHPTHWPASETLPPIEAGLVREVLVALPAIPVVHFESAPGGAVVERADGTVLGTTPFDWPLPLALATGEGDERFALRRDGYATVELVRTRAALRAGTPVVQALSPHNPAALAWVRVDGATFGMGSDGARSFPWEGPRHTVTVPAVELGRSEVTVAEYRRCVDAGGCTPPGTGAYCAWGVPGSDARPVNCVDREQARTFAAWAGGRLPSEAEWELAARSGGLDRRFPWGEALASCRRAILGEGCGRTRASAPVCSKPGGHTVEGLCDMAGNAAEWVADCWHDDYRGAPTDGRAWTDECREAVGVVRGGSWVDAPVELTTTARRRMPLAERRFSVGLRVARTPAEAPAAPPPVPAE